MKYERGKEMYYSILLDFIIIFHNLLMVFKGHQVFNSLVILNLISDENIIYGNFKFSDFLVFQLKGV